MWVSQREITEAYLNGEDILRKYNFRRTLCMVLVGPPFALAALALLYVLKSAAGINLFEEHHLIDLLQALV